MNLVFECLNVIFHGQILLEVLDILRILIGRCKHAYWCPETLGIIWIHHGRMDLCCSSKRGTGLAGQGDNLHREMC